MTASYVAVVRCLSRSCLWRREGPEALALKREHQAETGHRDFTVHKRRPAVPQKQKPA